jgi:methyl-accepting chemotaxis protein
MAMRGTGLMRDVAQQTHRTTEEQARGAGRIQGSIESVREAVERIHAALREQSEACRQAVSFLGQIYQRTRSNEDSTRRMSEATQRLQQQADALREDVLRFRIE